jgi:hypothetical protein
MVFEIKKIPKIEKPKLLFPIRAKENKFVPFSLLIWTTVMVLAVLVFPDFGRTTEEKPDIRLITATAAKESKEGTGTAPLPLEEMHITAYTKAFAERFGLEPPAPGTEPSGGLEAMELTVEKPVKWSYFYNCHFYLYLDSSLPIKFPEQGVAGNVWMLICFNHFFARPPEQRMKWSVQDRRHSSTLDGNYNMKAFLATMDYIPNKKGAIDSIDYVEFHKDLLPGLNYIKLEVIQDLVLEKISKDVGIFLQKSTDTDNRSRSSIEPGDFLKFRIPDHVFVKLKEWGLKVRKVNNESRNEHQQKAKELKDTQQ